VTHAGLAVSRNKAEAPAVHASFARAKATKRFCFRAGSDDPCPLMGDATGTLGSALVLTSRLTGSGVGTYLGLPMNWLRMMCVRLRGHHDRILTGTRNNDQSLISLLIFECFGPGDGTGCVLGIPGDGSIFGIPSLEDASVDARSATALIVTTTVRMMTNEQASLIDGWWLYNEWPVTVTNHVAPFCYVCLGIFGGSAKIFRDASRHRRGC
jgi:hypothetical protein